jgi:hypothetical protein
MNSERIKELQEQTAYPESRSVHQALLQVWNECQQEHNKDIKCIEFSKYIRNGKDHFNNGYSTEMVYDEWVEKYIYSTKLNDNAESLCFCCGKLLMN